MFESGVFISSVGVHKDLLSANVIWEAPAARIPSVVVGGFIAEIVVATNDDGGIDCGGSGGFDDSNVDIEEEDNTVEVAVVVVAARKGLVVVVGSLAVILSNNIGLGNGTKYSSPSRMIIVMFSNLLRSKSRFPLAGNLSLVSKLFEYPSVESGIGRIETFSELTSDANVNAVGTRALGKTSLLSLFSSVRKYISSPISSISLKSSKLLGSILSTLKSCLERIWINIIYMIFSYIIFMQPIALKHKLR